MAGKNEVTLTRTAVYRLCTCKVDGCHNLTRAARRGPHALCDLCRRKARVAVTARYRRRQKESGAPPPYLAEQHGMTLDDFLAMLDAQDGRCAGCGRTPPIAGKGLHIDHDHTCCPQGGRSCEQCRRGLLCAECNMALGLLRDNPETLARLAAYVREGGSPSWLATK